MIGSTMNRAPAVLVAPVLCLPVLLGACSGDGGETPGTPGTAGTASAGPPATASPLPSGAPAGSPPPLETARPSVAISTLPAVAVGETAPLAEGVTVTVGGIEATEVEANGPGDVAGDGAAVAVSVANRTALPFDLGGLVVTATYGANQPASPGGAGNGTPLTGVLKAGASAAGTYVFSVPASALSSLRVQVSSDSSPNVIVFRR